MIFLCKQELIEIHKKLIDEFGGAHGLRDVAALESTVAVSENRAYYEDADISICAATYAYHITQAHAFIDGNKRIAAATSEIFLKINGGSLNALNNEIYELFMSIAAGEKSRDEVEKIFSGWVKKI
ncbi:type II toxin-antitoxin system death-on-curing family toxin [Desulfococcaceae bacterium HSG9]|nr:type II toxin-antitoxin system death-on-curing family toxin [Desulfococcaceae bacterium HSG9]